MDKLYGQVTIYFDGMYWAGLFERVENNKLTVAKVVFGGEPSEPEVYDFVLNNSYDLQYSPAVETVIREQQKDERRVRSREKKRAEEQRRFELKQQKKREKHRGR